MLFRNPFFLFLFIFILLVPNISSALPKSQKVEITAEKLEVLGQGEKILADGDVFVETESTLILAKQILYEAKLELLHLKNFQIFDFTQNSSLRGDWATLDLRHHQFFANQVFLFIKKSGVKIKAFNFQKNALNEYQAERAIVSTCELDCDREEFPPWSFEVRNFTFGPDELSTAEASLFRIKKVPIFYSPKSVLMPKLNVPVLQERKRGFLLPNLSQGNRLGTGFQLPFFLPLTDQIDLTLSPFYFTKRGLLFDVENRIKLTEDVQSTLNYRYLEDTNRGEYEPKAPKTPSKRWWIVGKADLGLKDYLDLHLDVDLVSDKAFLEEFNVGEGGFDRLKNNFLQVFKRDLDDKYQDYRTSTFWLKGYKGSFTTRFSSSYYDYHGDKDEKTILQPLANLNLQLLPVPLKFFFPALAIDYNYFYRPKDYYGHRLSPSLEANLPFYLYGFKNLLKLSLIQDLYYLAEKGNFTDQSFSRFILMGKFLTYTLLKRNYEFPLGRFPLQFEHIIKPYALLTYQTKPTKTEIPIFVEEDEIRVKTLALEYGAWQFFHLPNRRNFFIIKAYQIYDLEKKKRSLTAFSPEERAFSDLYLQFILQGGRLNLRYDTAYNFYGLGWGKHIFTAALQSIGLDQIGLQYQEDVAWNVKQLNLDFRHILWQKIALNFHLSRNLRIEETSELKLEVLYLHDCYLLGLGVSSTPRDTKFHFMINLIGLGGLGSTPISSPLTPK